MRFACPWIFITLTPYIPVSQILVFFYFILLLILILLFSCCNSSFLCFSQTVFERNCQSDDCAADLKLQGKLLLSRWVGELFFFPLSSFLYASMPFILCKMAMKNQNTNTDVLYPDWKDDNSDIIFSAERSWDVHRIWTPVVVGSVHAQDKTLSPSQSQ